MFEPASNHTMQHKVQDIVYNNKQYVGRTYKKIGGDYQCIQLRMQTM